MRHKRIVVTRYGGPDVITLIEEHIPVPKAGEVRVKVLAAGVSLPDVLAREGVHPETPRVPYTPGWDFVGTVDQLGEGVTGFELCQTVAAMPISRVLRAVSLRATTQACAGACAIGRSGGGRRGVELHHRVSDAASIGEGPTRPAHVDSRGLGWRRLGDAAAGEAGRHRDVRNVLGAGGRRGPGNGRHSHRLQERGLREGDSSPYR